MGLNVLVDELGDKGAEFVRLDGFFQIRPLRGAQKSLSVRADRVARQEREPLDLGRVEIGDVVEHSPPIHIRHFEITQNQRETAFLQLLEGLFARPRERNVEPIPAKDLGNHISHVMFVFDHQAGESRRSREVMCDDFDLFAWAARYG